MIVITDNPGYHTGGAVKRYLEETKGEVSVAPTLCLRTRRSSILTSEVWNHAKARLAKRFVATKDEFKAAMFSILFSIQRSRSLILSFFQLRKFAMPLH